MSTAGYSGTPLVKKLGIRDGYLVCAIHAPKGYRDRIDPIPPGARIAARLNPAADLVHVFTPRKADLRRELAACRGKLRPETPVWVSWPKKSAKVPTDITEDTVREIALPLGYVDVKVCAVDEVWSGLKLVVRKDLRPSPERRA
jgi:hypothetical protein